uniref:hypothetical protein n=1 Tax=Sphingobacterium sp. TaxID=341027 RepID=UPI0031D4BCE4
MKTYIISNTINHIPEPTRSKLISCKLNKNIIHTAFNGLVYVDQAGAAEMLALESQVIQAADEMTVDWTG